MMPDVTGGVAAGGVFFRRGCRRGSRRPGPGRRPRGIRRRAGRARVDNCPAWPAISWRTFRPGRTNSGSTRLAGDRRVCLHQSADGRLIAQPPQPGGGESWKSGGAGMSRRHVGFTVSGVRFLGGGRLVLRQRSSPGGSRGTCVTDRSSARTAGTARTSQWRPVSMALRARFRASATTSAAQDSSAYSSMIACHIAGAAAGSWRRTGPVESRPSLCPASPAWQAPVPPGAWLPAAAAAVAVEVDQGLELRQAAFRIEPGIVQGVEIRLFDRQQRLGGPQAPVRSSNFRCKRSSSISCRSREAACAGIAGEAEEKGLDVLGRTRLGIVVARPGRRSARTGRRPTAAAKSTMIAATIAARLAARAHGLKRNGRRGAAAADRAGPVPLRRRR